MSPFWLTCLEVFSFSFFPPSTARLPTRACSCISFSTSGLGSNSSQLVPTLSNADTNGAVLINDDRVMKS